MADQGGPARGVSLRPDGVGFGVDRLRVATLLGSRNMASACRQLESHGFRVAVRT